VLQLAGSIVLILVGVALGLFVDTTGDMHAFGWLLAGLGAFGLLARSWLARRRDGPDLPGRRQR